MTIGTTTNKMNHLLNVTIASLILLGCNGKFDRTQASANLIIEALQSYKEDNGFYPDKLQDITPLYLEKLPKSNYSNRDFIYEKSEDSYQLVYLGAFGVEATYHSSTKLWSYDD
jgi:hypothetical protein